MSASLASLSEEGLWQVVEFADYTADLPLWRELADSAAGTVLDLGCGVGRVARQLASCGASVTGVDIDPGLVRDFIELAGDPGWPAGGSATAVAMDATGIGDLAGPLAGRDFDLVLAPQQFVQLLDAHARGKLLEGVARRLAPQGLAAFAICEELPRESIHFPGVLPDAREDGGWYYSSMPVAIEPSHGWITSLRRRDRVSPDGDVRSHVEEVRIYRLDRQGLEREMKSCGLAPSRIVDVPQTERHMGSTVVIARLTGPDRPA